VKEFTLAGAGLPATQKAVAGWQGFTAQV